MQMAVVEFARHVLDLRDAHTSELNPHTTYPVIDLMEDQDLGNLGGTMRLGKCRCLLTPAPSAKGPTEPRKSGSATATATNSATPFWTALRPAA